MGGYPGNTRYPSGNFEPYDAETTPQYTGYSGLDEDFEYQPPGADNERWKWVAGIAAVVLALAVIATAVVLSGGNDKPPVTAITTSAPSLPPVTTTSAPPASATTRPKPTPSTTTVTESAAPETPSTISQTSEPPPPPPPPNPLLPPENEAPNTPAGFVYYVSGNQTPGDLLTITYTDGAGASHTVLGASLPWTMIVSPSPGLRGGSVTATSFASQINCTISNSSQEVLAVQSNNSTMARCTK